MVSVAGPTSASKVRMSIKCCFECDMPAEHDHHVVPQSIGGTKTVPLCAAAIPKFTNCAAQY